MKYYLIAGEASGDLHGSNLMKGISEADEDPGFRFFGGDKMCDQGGELVKHYCDMSYMGLFAVLLNILTIRKNFQLCKKDILSWHPDVIILIDFAGFNLRIAKFAKKHGFKVFYYISPKVWAWNKSRVKTIRKAIDKMFVILPFEVDFYKQFNYDVEYLGNPILDAVTENPDLTDDADTFIQKNRLNEKPLIALLPGSRIQEIERCLPEMISIVPDFPEYQFVIAASPGLDRDLYNRYIVKKNVGIVYSQMYELLNHSVAAVVTSGTATLETALMNVPEVVCYKTGLLSYLIGKRFVRLRFFSLVNLITGKEVVKEILQYRLKEKISAELSRILYDEDYREEMLNNFKELRKILGEPGASQRIGRKIVDLVKSNH